MGLPTDVIAITAVRDLQVVRSAISAGIVQYLIKPFTYSAFHEKLGAYREFRQNLTAQASSTTQSEVDQAFAALRPAPQGSLPKGLSDETLRAVTALLKSLDSPTSAAEVAGTLALSRVTARRYLEYLADQQSASRSPRYGTRGRPEFEYSWAR
jgi:response regulator of citrate/malate metabolism